MVLAAGEFHPPPEAETPEAEEAADEEEEEAPDVWAGIPKLID